jgi:hypothetical protein
MNYESDSRPKRAQDFLQEKMRKPNYNHMVESQVYKKLGEDNATSNYDSVMRGRQASAAANETVKANDMFKGLRQSVVDQGDAYQASSRMRQAGLFGDVWNVKSPPKWVAPEDPEKIETTYQDMDDDDD